MKYTTIIILFFSIFSLEAKAEYRLYQYLIEAKDYDGKKITYTEVSSFAPMSYRSYRANQNNFTLVRSWMCVGSTSNFKTCPPLSDALKRKGTKGVIL